MNWKEAIDKAAEQEVSKAVPDMLDYLHPELVTHYSAVALNVRTAPELIALSHLSVIASVIGDKMDIEAIPGYITHPIIWSTALVPSGGAKSPSAQAAHGSLQCIQDELDDEYNDLLKKYNADKKVSEPPTRKVINLSNGTIQGQLSVMQDSAGACYRYQDEMSGFFNGMDQFQGGKGNEQEKWLELFNGSPYRDIMGKGEVYIRKPRLSICGMSQPEVFLPIIAKRTDNCSTGANGMFARFLMISPPKVSRVMTDFDAYKRGGVNRKEWEQFNSNFLMNLKHFDRYIQWRITDDTTHKFMFDTINKYMMMTEQPDMNGYVQAFLNKAAAHISRLAVVLAATDLSLTTDLSNFNNGGTYEPDCYVKEIPLDVLKRAVGLYEYFLDQVYIIVARIRSSEESTTSYDVGAIEARIIQKVTTKFNDGIPFTPSKVRQCFKLENRKSYTDQLITKVLKSLNCSFSDGKWTLPSTF